MRLRVDAMAQIRRQTIVNDELPAHDAVRLGVSSSLEPAGSPKVAHLRLEARDDGFQVNLFIGYRLFLGDFQVLVGAPHVDQCRGQSRDGIAQHSVERRTEKRIESAFQMHERQRCIRDPVEERRSGIGRRHRTANI